MPPNYAAARGRETSARRTMILALLAASAVLLARPPPPAAAAAATATAMQPKASCLRRCGDIDIPYPFGVGAGCHLETGDWTFSLTCNRSDDGKRFRLYNYQIEVMDMSVRHGQLRIYNVINPWCYNSSTRAMNEQHNWWYNMSITNFRVNDALNRFTVIGCNSLAYIRSLNDSADADTYMTGCMAMCPGVARLEDGACGGLGCCQTAIPGDLNAYWVSYEDKFNTSGIAGFSPCSYAVLLEAAAFEFRAAYVTTDAFVKDNGGQVPLVLDWAIGNLTCEQAKRNASAFACVSGNSECVDSRYGRGRGYLCNCSAGYDGNPYLLDGCQDINECEDARYPCSVPGTCVNTMGSFYCACPDKTTGNAYNGTCQDKKTQIGWQIAIGVTGGGVVLIVTATCLYMIHEKRRLAKIKSEYFRQHGGLLLFEEMKSRQGLSFTLFTHEELEAATDRFDERNVIGKGGNGTVYRGTTSSKDGGATAVAIKRCRLANERQKKEFGKEMLILSQINHRNIVKLYGCCLEVEVPMLVYKYIPNGTLYRLIHGGGWRDRIAGDGAPPRIPLALRLRIAHQAAEALAYLHSWASPPIIHGDVKTSNILLDEDYTAKVSDFGASAMVAAPTDEAQLVTLVQGTCGYLDPEYMRTCRLTDRSDVYSFGVVLLELLTRRKALNLEELEEDKYLSSQFLVVLGEGRLEDILDEQLKGEHSFELLEQVAELAKRCLEMTGDRRPSMRQVAEELERLCRLSQHPWGRQNSEEILALLGGSPSTGSEIELSTSRNISFSDTAYIGIRSPR